MSDSISPAPEPFADLKVPDEPGVWFCAKHKTTKTRLRCGRCEKPICPKCTVMAPTGARCGDCASNRTSHVYKVGPLQLLLASTVGLFIGAFGAFVVAGGLFVAFWLVLYGYAIGPALGRIIIKVTGGKRGPVLAVAVCGGLVAGAIGVRAGAEISAYHQAKNMATLVPEMAVPYMPDPLSWGLVALFLAVSVSSTWWYLK